MSASRRDAAAVALAAGQARVDVATQAGVTARTVRRWTREPDFQSTVEALRRERVSRLMNRIDEYADRALAFLAHTMADPDQPISARIRCATALASPVVGKQSAEPFHNRWAQMNWDIS